MSDKKSTTKKDKCCNKEMKVRTVIGSEAGKLTTLHCEACGNVLKKTGK